MLDGLDVPRCRNACHRISAGCECLLGFGPEPRSAGPDSPYAFASTHLRYPVKENRKSIVRSFVLCSDSPLGTEQRQTCYYKARKGDTKKTKTKNRKYCIPE